VIRILIADDHALVRGGFGLILTAHDDLEVVAEVADGRAAVDAAARLRPDLVLMDVRMPELDGIAATRAILAAPALHPPKVLMVTTFDLDEYVYDAMRAGASGFLLKDVSPADLVHGIRTIVAGDALLAPAIVRRLVDQYVARPLPTGAPSGRLADLTERELDVRPDSHAGCPTQKSPPSSTFPPRRSRRTSPASWPSSGSATGSTP